MAMTLTRGGGTFTPHPEGVFRAVFVNWEEAKSPEDGSDQVKLSFDTEEMMDDGRPFRISKWCKPSLHEKAFLPTLLKALGQDPNTIQDGVEIDEILDPLIGGKCQLVIQHYKGKDGTQKAKIASCAPLRTRSRVAFAETPPAAAAVNWDEED